MLEVLWLRHAFHVDTRIVWLIPQGPDFGKEFRPDSDAGFFFLGKESHPGLVGIDGGQQILRYAVANFILNLMKGRMKASC